MRRKTFYSVLAIVVSLIIISFYYYDIKSGYFQLQHLLPSFGLLVFSLIIYYANKYGGVKK